MLTDLGLQTQEQIDRHKDFMKSRINGNSWGCVSTALCKNCNHLFSDSICLCSGLGVCLNCGFDNINFPKIESFLNCEPTNKLEKIKEAAKILVEKLDEIDKDERYKRVWANYMIHGNKYEGPFYIDELNNLKEILK